MTGRVGSGVPPRAGVSASLDHRELEVLAAMDADDGWPLEAAEIARRLGWKSGHSVQPALLSLREKGAVESKPYFGAAGTKLLWRRTAE